jgi:hypothetical protein
MSKEQSHSRPDVDQSNNQKIVSGELTDKDLQAIFGGIELDSMRFSLNYSPVKPVGIVIQGG